MMISIKTNNNVIMGYRNNKYYLVINNNRCMIKINEIFQIHILDKLMTERNKIKPLD